MIGLVLVTHGALAQEFLAAVEYIVGPQKQVETVCFMPNDDIKARREEILQKVHRTDSGQGVLILTDMFGGTPSNLSISLLDKENIEVVAGLNLPMLVRLVGLRTNVDLKNAALSAEEAGKKYINIASKILEG